MKFLILLTALLIVGSQGYFPFNKVPSADLTKAQVLGFLSQELGNQQFDLDNRLFIADVLATHSDEKTWASTYDLFEYTQTLAPKISGNTVKANAARFGYPDGETSGGYGVAPVARVGAPWEQWEHNSRETMQWAYNYMVQLGQTIGGFLDLFPIRPAFDNPQNQDQPCERRFHATHAELKLLTRLIRRDNLQPGQQVIMSVSRGMCEYCRPVVAHLARNGARKILVATPRKKGKGKSPDQPEFVYFRANGEYTTFQRRNPDSQSPWAVTNYVWSLNPSNIDNYVAPDPNFAVSRQLSNAVRKAERKAPRVAASKFSPKITGRNVLASCGIVKEGPGNNCVSLMTKELPKAVTCPDGMTITGIHGGFGITNQAAALPNDLVPALTGLRTIGIFCDNDYVSPEMGTFGLLPFVLKCPAGYQLTGLRGYFGDFVDKISIICRRVTDGHKWVSEIIGNGTGGKWNEQECEPQAAGNKIGLWIEEAIDGIGVCCR